VTGEALACGFRLTPRGAPAPRLVVGIRAGDRMVRTVEVTPEQAAGGRVKVALPAHGLPPGEYRLVVQEGGPGAPVERGSLEFRIAAPGPGQGRAGTGTS
jgi:hypothetical protein